jgi:hypothetical protein
MHTNGRNYDAPGSGHMDSGFVSARFAAGSVMELLGASFSLKFGLNLAYFNPNFVEDEKNARLLIKQSNRKPWPHASSVFIHDDKIIVYMR